MLARAYSVKIGVILVSSLQDKKLIKSKPTWKLKHANSILETFEYYWQISSKSITIILTYISFQSWCIFLRHSVYA